MTAPVDPAGRPADTASPATPGRWRAPVEALVVCGLALFAIFQVIPRQTASGEDAAGLAPATLPTVCAVVIAVLALLNLAVTWPRKRTGVPSPDGGAQPEEAQPEPAQPGRSAPATVILMMLVTLAGAIVLRLAGAAACTATIVVLGMLVLGERRLTRIVPVTMVAVLPYLLLFR